MTLPRLLLAMTIRSLATRIEQRIDPIVSTIVGAVGFVTEGRWDADFILAMPDIVAIQGAKLSGVVAGCGCDADAVSHCYRELCAPHPCPCGCHAAAQWVMVAVADIHDAIIHDVPHSAKMVRKSLVLAREALAARPKPEADDIDDDWQDYGVTAPGGCS